MQSKTKSKALAQRKSASRSPAAKPAASKRAVHFHSSDDRFCGSREAAREFSFDPNIVSCKRCQSRDTFVLSPEAAAFVASLSVGVSA